MFFFIKKDVIMHHVFSLFNKILDLGYIPSSWFEGYVVPLHKECNVNNYRGITLLTFYKVVK